MYFKRLNGTHSLRFSNLAACHGLVHAVFTRQGGRSTGPYESLNVSDKTGDMPGHVSANRALVDTWMGGNSLFCLNQVHSADIVIIRKTEEEKIPLPNPPLADAIITDIPGLDLMIMTADCQAVFLFDPNGRVCANIHSGWRGSLKNIIAKTVDAMKKNFSTDPENLMAGIGPSLGPCCAEFINFRKEISAGLWNYRHKTDSNKNISSNYFNFWNVSRDQLVAAGVRPENIEVSGICTKCNPSLFFSYRKSRITGRFANVIGLRE
ncbi:MAG: peptidoglycan editing factor PgeF [Deltaproteobacteria bacterium]|nr:peptidoglycan editing factor PgeF [Deltaproteobacteria bacterium]